MSASRKFYKQGGDGSYGLLNAKYNQLLALLEAGGGGPPLPTSSDLADILTNGDDAGGLDITNLDDLGVATINGDTFNIDGVLNAGDTATGKQMLLEATLPSTNFTLYKPDEIQVSDGVNDTVSFQPTQLQYTDITGTVSATWADIISGSASSNTLQEVLDAGSTADIGYSLSLTAPTTVSSISADIPLTDSTFDVGYIDTSAGTTATSTIKSQLNQTDYSSSVQDTPNGLLGTKTLITIGGAILNTDTATASTGAVGLRNSTTTTSGVQTGSQLNNGAGIVSSLNTTVDATIAGQTHLFQTASQDTTIQLTASNGNAGIASSYVSTPFNVFTQGEFSQNTGGSICSIQATDVAGSQNQLLRMECPLVGNAQIEHLATGASASTKNLLITSTGNLLLTSDTLNATATNLNMSSSAVGNIANPILTLTNTNATGSVAMECYKNKPTPSVNGDVLFTQSVFGKDSGNAKQEFTRINHSVRDVSAGVEDGSIEFGCFVNGAINTFLQINGNENEVNILRTLDMASNPIRSSTGTLNIDSSVLMDNSESFTQRNTANTIVNSQSISSISLSDITNISNTNQNAITNSYQEIINQQINTYRNTSNAFSTIIKETDSGSVDIKKLDLETNLIRLTDSSASPNTEIATIYPTAITFQSSGSATDSLSMYNDSADGGEIDWTNVSGTNGLVISSSHSLTLKATASTYPIQFDSDVINLQNTNTTTSTSNHNADIRTTSNGVSTTTFLKLQLNGADIWIPYFTSDPSL
jgi:hypothetical protein